VILSAEGLSASLSPSRSNLETIARKARFRLLGKACWDRKISRLHLGHHSDDQYETALARIAKNADYSLGTVNELKNIPENEGVYGVHESGQPVDFYTDTDTNPTSVRGFESGGVKVFRPLLDYSKAELFQICQQNSVPWVEDQSNFDKTLTIRNAIRHGLSNDILPRALRKQNILNLVKRNEATLQVHMDLAEILIELCVIRFNPSLGQAFVRIPRHAIQQCILQIQSGHEQPNLLLTVSLFIRRLIQMVSPNEHVNLTKLAEIAKDWIQSSNPNSGKSPIKECTFQAGGAQITSFTDPEVYMPYLDTPQRLSNINFKRLDTVVIFRHSEAKARISDSGLASLKSSVSLVLDIPVVTANQPTRRKSLQSGSKLETNKYTFSPFQLYDNRFWLSLYNPFPHPLRIRPLRPSDFDILASRFSTHKLNLEVHCTSPASNQRDPSTVPSSNRWLLQTAPRQTSRRPATARRALARALGVSRQALLQTIVPVIEYVEPPTANDDMAEATLHILGLPTLGVRVLPGPEHGISRSGAYRLPKRAKELTWVVRYKQVDWGAHANQLVEEVLVLPTTRNGRERQWCFNFGGRWADDTESTEYVKLVDEKLTQFYGSYTKG
jgi:hypothetical protein